MQASFNFIVAVSICSDFGAQNNKVSHCFHCSPIYLPWSDGTGCCGCLPWLFYFRVIHNGHLSTRHLVIIGDWNAKVGSQVLATEWNTNTAELLEFLYFNTCFLQLLYFISLAQQSTGQAAKHYDSETIQCAGAGRDNLYFDLLTAAKTLFWGTFLSA